MFFLNQFCFASKWILKRSLGFGRLLVWDFRNIFCKIAISWFPFDKTIHILRLHSYHFLNVSVKLWEGGLLKCWDELVFPGIWCSWAQWYTVIHSGTQWYTVIQRRQRKTKQETDWGDLGSGWRYNLLTKKVQIWRRPLEKYLKFFSQWKRWELYLWNPKLQVGLGFIVSIWYLFFNFCPMCVIPTMYNVTENMTYQRISRIIDHVCS